MSTIPSLRKKGRFGSWLSSKLALKKKKQDTGVSVETVSIEAGGCSPLMGNMDVNNPRKKQLVKAKLITTPDDDCSQLLASSDQASAVARIDDHPIDSYPSEHYGSDCSVTDSVLAVTSHMATIRSLLVGHIRETRNTSNEQIKLAAGPSAAGIAPVVCNTHAAAAAAGHRSSKDKTVQALLADQMQLLDLVQTLITDHRTSLLEQQRLQQQLVAAEKALHAVQLDKERAVALAEVRAEQVSHAKADLAVASAAAQKLHSVRAISSQRIALPPASNGPSEISSPISNKCGRTSPYQITPNSRASAIIGRIAPENSWQDQHAIVGPAPPGCIHQPLAAGALLGQLAASADNRRGTAEAAGNRSSTCKQATSATSRKGIIGKLTNRQNLDDNSNRWATAGVAVDRALNCSQQSSGRQRRLLADTSRGCSESSLDSQQAARAAAATAPWPSIEVHQGSTAAEQWQPAPADGTVHVQILQQRPQQQQQRQHQVAVSAAAAQHAAALAAAPSAASKLAQVHAFALESLLLQRLQSSSAEAGSQPHQHLLSASIETDGSALSVAWAAADTDAVAAAAGVTKQQLKQLLHRPWLLRASQEKVAPDLKQEPAPAATALPMRSKQQPVQQHRVGGDSERDNQHDSNTSSQETCIQVQHLDDGSSSDGSSIVDGEMHCAGSIAATAGNAGAGQQAWQTTHPHSRHSSSGPGSKEGLVCASNGSSWPAMQMSTRASGHGAVMSVLPPPAGRPSPYQRPAARVRPRGQPVQVSTSLESAATLLVASQPVPQSHGSQSSCVTTAAVSVAGAQDERQARFDPSCCGTSPVENKYSAAAAAASGNEGCIANSQPSGGSRQQQQRAQQQQQQQHQRDLEVDMSCELVQQASLENLSSAMSECKPGHPAAAAGPSPAVHVLPAVLDSQQQLQRKRVGCHKRQQQQQQASSGPRHPSAAATARQSPGQVGAPESDDEQSTTSDFASMSVASVATGCSTLSNMAAIDFVPRSNTKARPAGVPKLNLLTGMCSSSPAGTQHVNSPREQAKLLAQQSDMVPLKAQKGTPRGTAVSRAAAAAATTGVEHAGESFTLCADAKAVAGSALGALAVRAHSFTAGHSSKVPAAAVGSSSTHTSSSNCSARSRRAATTGGAAAGAPMSQFSSARGAAAAAAAAGGQQYWGSSAGSYPASEEPSRQPTPTVDLSGMQIYAPTGADRPPAAAAAVSFIAASGLDAEAMATGDGINEHDAAEGLTSQQQQPCFGQLPPHLQATVAAAAAAAAAAGQTGTSITPRTAAFMTMRPAHLYKSVSTQFAMYSPLRGNLHALGQSKPGGSPAAAGEAGGDGSDMSGLSGLVKGSTVGVGALGATAAVGEHGLSRDVSGNGSEHHWHQLLGTVTEEEGVADDSVGPSADGQQLAAAAVSLHTAMEPTAGAAVATEPGVKAAVSHRTVSDQSSCSASASPELVYATSLPTLEDFQRMVQQEQQQRAMEQQHQQQDRELSMDVIDRGPLYNPQHSSPEAGDQVASCSRPVAGGGSSSHQRVSLRASQATAAASPSAIQVTELEMGAVGPLTASSPTRKRNSGALSSSSVGHPQQQPQLQLSTREPNYSASTSSSRARASNSAAVARVEAAATAVAARVAAVASRSSRRSQQQQRQEPLREQPEQPQVPAHEASRLASTAATAMEQAAVPGNSGAQRVRRRWVQQQQQQQAVDHAQGGEQACSSLGLAAATDSTERPPSVQKAKRQHLSSMSSDSGQQQLRCDEVVQSHHKCSSSSRGSSKQNLPSNLQTAQSPTAAAAAGLKCGANLGFDSPVEMVTSYHNPMLLLEGIDAADEAALISAGLIAGFAPRGLAAAEGWKVYGDALAVPNSASKAMPSFDTYSGVEAAAVSAYATPIGKERSAGAVSQAEAGSVVAAEQIAGGQLHWNPLYDPNALDGSPVISY